MRTLLDDLQIETRKVSDLVPSARNPRTHSRKQVRQLTESIKAFGWTNPILVDGKGCVLAGHGRLEAAKLLGLSEVPTIRLDRMSEAQKRAYILADNRLAEKAGWDEELLKIELEALLELDLSFDIEVTGFETPEIDFLVAEASTPEIPDADDTLPETPQGPPVTRPGDVWLLGRHRVLCGDALEAMNYAQSLDGEAAQMAFTDPPYNVPVAGYVMGKGKPAHADFAMASGEMSEAEFTAFLEQALGRIRGYAVDGAVAFVCMDWRHLDELLAAGKASHLKLLNLCVWAKSNGGMGSLYRSAHELVAVFKVGSGPHINNVELGRHGRNRTNVWRYPGFNAFLEGREDALNAHPTVKPIALVADAILDCSSRGGLVLDPFLGSGTTILAAERTGRRAAGLELEPRYLDVTLERYWAVTGDDPIHAETGRTFGTLKAERMAEAIQ